MNIQNILSLLDQVIITIYCPNFVIATLVISEMHVNDLLNQAFSFYYINIDNEHFLCFRIFGTNIETISILMSLFQQTI